MTPDGASVGAGRTVLNALREWASGRRPRASGGGHSGQARRVSGAFLALTLAACLATVNGPHARAQTPLLPIADVHIHYSHDAWDQLPPPKALEALREAGLKLAFVSSSSDEGTQKLYALAPDFIVPVLRPYRRRGETSSWLNDETVPGMLADRLAKNRYAGIGEFHVFGERADGPVMREVVQLARLHGLFLHAHSDADAIERLFQQDPEALIVWAHSGFDNPEDVRAMLAKHPNLWADLAFRSEHAYGENVDPDWRAVFEAFPERFMVGTDTFTPERWYFVSEHANWSRQWLSDLEPELAERIGYRNAEQLLQRVAARQKN